MFEFFDTIINLIGTIGNFIISTVVNIVIVLGQMITGVEAIAIVYTYLPNIVSGIAMVIISYCIVVNIINKGG